MANYPEGSVSIAFPGGGATIAPPTPATALQNAKDWLALARASSDAVFIAGAIDRAVAALELLPCLAYFAHGSSKVPCERCGKMQEAHPL